MSGAVVVSNRGPLTFRAGEDGALVPVRAAGGLASSLHRILAGSGTTWASVAMGAADREAVAQGLMHEDGLDLVPVVIDDDTYRQAYDVVANTTLWYCHHHLFDLPHRPRFDRYWREAWEGYRAYNRAMADVIVDRAGEGAAVYVQDYHFSLLGRMLAEARPDLRTVHFLHTPFAAPDMLAVLPDDVRAELLDGMAGYAACGFHCHQWEACFRACYAAAGREAPSTFVAPLGTDAGALEDEAASPECAVAAVALRAEVDGRRIIARTDRMEPSKNIVRGMLAFEELLIAYPEWRGRVVHVALAYPSRQGLAEYLAYGADVEHTAERINHAVGSDELDAHCALRPGRLAPLARRAHAVGRAAGQPRTRRPEPRGQGGPAAQHGRRRAGAVPPGRGVGGAGARRRRRARGQPLRHRRYRRRAARRPLHGRADARRAGGCVAHRGARADGGRLVGRPARGCSGLTPG